jgi:hypothetical protein
MTVAPMGRGGAACCSCYSHPQILRSHEGIERRGGR